MPKLALSLPLLVGPALSVCLFNWELKFISNYPSVTMIVSYPTFKLLQHSPNIQSVCLLNRTILASKLLVESKCYLTEVCHFMIRNHSLHGLNRKLLLISCSWINPSIGVISKHASQPLSCHTLDYVFLGKLLSYDICQCNVLPCH